MPDLDTLRDLLAGSSDPLHRKAWDLLTAGKSREDVDKLITTVTRMLGRHDCPSSQHHPTTRETHMSLLARITAHAGVLAIEGFDGEDPDWLPNGDGRVGCSVMGTKTRLGISREAADLLKTVKLSQDAIGDVMWSKCDDGRVRFGWLGGPLAIVNLEKADGDRGYAFQEGEYVDIPNDVPEGAKAAIDRSAASSA